MSKEKVLWENWKEPVEYARAVELMKFYAEGVKSGSAQQRIMLLQHSEVYTSPHVQKSSIANGIKIEPTNRGGGITCHSPGQRVIYPILDLRRYKMDLHWYISTLENWLVEALVSLKVPVFANNRGIWLNYKSEAAKIGFIGIRVESWITLHGCAINISNNLKHFSHINPCGIEGCKVTSCKAAGYPMNMREFDLSLMESFKDFFYS